MFTVDILNEGVDIPSVNTVLFLRPTDSSTIFLQQLGRGLRKYPNKSHVTVLDFIGNSYKRSVQIAFALGSLAKNFVLEKRLLKSLVKDNFAALGLQEYGVEVNIDDLSREEIINFLDQENFNNIRYLKQDYVNFKKYINSDYYPKNMDYLYNDCAPNLLRFMNVTSGGKKNRSYYNFLKGIKEEHLPVFSDEQVNFINILSNALPLVRPYEYEIVRALLYGPLSRNGLEAKLTENIDGYDSETLKHALQFIGCLKEENGQLSLNVEMDQELKEYTDDLIEYGLTRWASENPVPTDFNLWMPYRMDQVQLKLLKNPGYNQLGTYYYDDSVVIFASLKKDLDAEDKLNYKDKFLEPDLFQWESKVNLSDADLEKLKSSKFAHVFIRKMEKENGIVLPFTYVGKGVLENPRVSDEKNGTWLFDIHMENKLPDYLCYDFGLENKE